MLEVKVKKLVSEAVIPQYAKDGDAGLDLTAVSVDLDSNGNAVYGTGLAFEIPEGHVGLLFPRSSVSKKDLSLANAVGVLDSGYRGEVILKYKPTPYFESNREQSEGGFRMYEKGDKVGQIIIMPYPKVQLVESEELSSTERGEGGFGHTGN